MPQATPTNKPAPSSKKKTMNIVHAFMMALASRKTGIDDPFPTIRGGYTYGSPIFDPRRGKRKGYMTQYARA